MAVRFSCGCEMVPANTRTTCPQTGANAGRVMHRCRRCANEHDRQRRRRRREAAGQPHRWVVGLTLRVKAGAIEAWAKKAADGRLVNLGGGRRATVVDAWCDRCRQAPPARGPCPGGRYD